MDRRLAYRLSVLVSSVLWTAVWAGAPISTWAAAVVPYIVGVVGEVLRDLELATPPSRKARTR